MEIVLIILSELILNLFYEWTILLAQTGYSSTTFFGSINHCIPKDASSQLFCVLENIYASGTQDAGVAKSLYFYFLCLLFNVIYSYFFICWLDFFLNIRFSNRSNSILRIKLSLSPHVIWSFSEVRIACFTWNTFLCLNCHFTNFSSLKLYINDLQN